MQACLHGLGIFPLIRSLVYIAPLLIKAALRGTSPICAFAAGLLAGRLCWHPPQPYPPVTTSSRRLQRRLGVAGQPTRNSMVEERWHLKVWSTNGPRCWVFSWSCCAWPFYINLKVLRSQSYENCALLLFFFFQFYSFLIRKCYLPFWLFDLVRLMYD